MVVIRANCWRGSRCNAVQAPPVWRRGDDHDSGAPGGPPPPHNRLVYGRWRAKHTGSDSAAAERMRLRAKNQMRQSASELAGTDFTQEAGIKIGDVSLSLPLNMTTKFCRISSAAAVALSADGSRRICDNCVGLWHFEAGKLLAFLPQSCARVVVFSRLPASL
jgi:hypothetical protein